MTDKTLCVVTATTNPERADACLKSWGAVPIIAVVNGFAGTSGSTGHITWLHHDDYLGTVPAFKRGTDMALEHGYEIICALHDDVLIQQPNWAERVLKHFERHPACGLLGFGGAIGLGADGLYDRPYDPMSLARIGFRSNLTDAEKHGIRSLLPEKVACLDGFSQIGRREFWEGKRWYGHGVTGEGFLPARPVWTQLTDLGLVHHFYDGALGAIAARHGWETWFLPIRCTHFGGRTAVGDSGYQDWAKTQMTDGDAGFWRDAHHIGYDAFRDQLPLRV